MSLKDMLLPEREPVLFMKKAGTELLVKFDLIGRVSCRRMVISSCPDRLRDFNASTGPFVPFTIVGPYYNNTRNINDELPPI